MLKTISLPKASKIDVLSERKLYEDFDKPGHDDRLYFPDFWGLSVSLVRTLSETLGVGKGLAINYLIALVFVFLLFGIPNLKSDAAEVLHLWLRCAIGTSMTFAFSLGLAKDGTQTMEVGMINYLLADADDFVCRSF